MQSRKVTMPTSIHASADAKAQMEYEYRRQVVSTAEDKMTEAPGALCT